MGRDTENKPWSEKTPEEILADTQAVMAAVRDNDCAQAQRFFEFEMNRYYEHIERQKWGRLYWARRLYKKVFHR